MSAPIDDENIIRLLGIESLPDERKIALVEKISELVQKRLLLRLLDSLSEPDEETMKGLLDSGDQPALQLFLNEKVPKLADWAVDEVLVVKKELADHATSVTSVS